MKRNVRQCLTSAFLGCVLLICGCGPPKMDPVPIRTIEELKCSTNYEGLEIAVDLYCDPTRVKRHFGTNLLTQQIVPVQVVFHNVEMQGGFLLQPELVVFMEQTGSETESGRGYSKVPSPILNGEIAAIAMMLSPLVTLPVLLVQGDIVGDAVDIRNHMESLRFRDRPLYPSDSNSGFLYFKLDDITNLQKVVAVRFRVKNIRSREESAVVVPIRKN